MQRPASTETPNARPSTAQAAAVGGRPSRPTNRPTRPAGAATASAGGSLPAAGAIQAVTPRTKAPVAPVAPAVETAPEPAPAKKKSAKKTPQPPKAITPRDRRILSFLYEARAARIEHVAIALSVKDEAARRALYRLREMALVESTRRGTYSTWKILPAAFDEIGIEGNVKPGSVTHLTHSLGITYLIALAFRDGLGVITDADIAKAAVENSAEAKAGGYASGPVIGMDRMMVFPPYDFDTEDPSEAKVWAGFMPFTTDKLTAPERSVKRNADGAVIRATSARSDLVTMRRFPCDPAETGGVSEYTKVFAHEIEISRKSDDRELLWKLAAYVDAIHDGRFDEVIYHCTAPVKRRLEALRDSRVDRKPTASAARNALTAEAIGILNDPAWEQIIFLVVDKAEYYMDGIDATM